MIFFLFKVITNMADVIIFALLTYWFFSIFFKKRLSGDGLGTILMPVIITATITIVLKILIQRGAPTPFVVPWTELRILFLPHGYAFPSGHASRAFALATVLSAKYPKKGVLFFVTAATIGFSRIYIGVHYPLDVIAGAILGVSISLVFAKALLER